MAQTTSQLPGTILSFYVPVGAAVTFANLMELTTPSGICIALRLPFLSSLVPSGTGLSLISLLNTLKAAGGSIELLK
jgi:hypothetical protein